MNRPETPGLLLPVLLQLRLLQPLPDVLLLPLLQYALPQGVRFLPAALQEGLHIL